jgi:hypothetical protein
MAEAQDQMPNIQHFDQNRVPERVEDLVAFLAVDHHVLAPKDREVLRGVGLFHPNWPMI